jgi:hypothetical protein
VLVEALHAVEALVFADRFHNCRLATEDTENTEKINLGMWRYPRELPTDKQRILRVLCDLCGKEL